MFTPNTTTTKNTETYEQINSNTPVNAPTGADPALNQQVGTQLVNNNVAAGSITNEAANVNVIPGGGQITDPNAPDYNANAAEFARDREAVLTTTTSKNDHLNYPTSLRPNIIARSCAMGPACVANCVRLHGTGFLPDRSQDTVS